MCQDIADVVCLCHLHLMPFISYLGHLLRERLNRVSWDVPACLDVVLVQHFQQSVRPNCGAEHATRDIGHVSWSTILCVEPAADGVNINAVANENLFRHFTEHDGTARVLLVELAG
jgi:hypothetical protein